MSDPTPSEPAFWEALYREGRAGWDLGAPAPAWERLVELHSMAPTRALILGGGRGHDALWFARRGFDVTCVDFAPSAVEATRAAALGAGQRVSVLERDLFTLDPADVGTFGLVVEHTCFCAILPERRTDYERVVAGLVRPGGFFIGVFFFIPLIPSAGEGPGGPPFGTSADELRRIFSSDFEVLRLEPNPVSVPSRAGREGWAVLRRRG